MSDVKAENTKEIKMEEIKKFIEMCPLLKGGKINIDFLEDDIDSYSIDRTPSNPVIKKFIDGMGGLYQITFDFSVTAPLSSSAIDNLANSSFCEEFMDWIATQNFEKKYPDIDGAHSISCTSPRIYIKKDRYTSNLYYSNEFYIL